MRINKKAILLSVSAAVLIILCFFAYNFGLKIYYSLVYPNKYSEYVEKYSAKYDVDKYLVYAVIHTESNFNPSAQSHLDAKGLMQITEETFEWAKTRMKAKDGASYDNIFDPEVNIKYGTYILHLLQQEFKSENTVIAAYHAGWGNVKKWLNDPDKSLDGIEVHEVPISQTNDYIKKVTNAKKIYESIYKQEE